MQIEVQCPRLQLPKVFWWDDDATVAECARHAYIAFYGKQPRGDIPFLQSAMGAVLQGEHTLKEAIKDPRAILELGSVGTAV